MQTEQPSSSGLRRWLRRPWYQVSLRGFLLITTVAAVWLGQHYAHRPLSIENAKDIQELARLDHAVWQIAWGPEGKELAMVGWETPVTILSTRNLKFRRTFGEGLPIIRFVFGPRGRFVAYTLKDRSIHLVDQETGRERVLQTDNDQPSIAFSPDGKTMADGGYGNEVGLWSTETGQRLGRLQGITTKGALTPVFSPDGKWLVVGNRNGPTVLFDVSTGRLVRKLFPAQTQELKFDPSGELLAVAYVDGSVAIWDVAKGKRLVVRRTSAEELYTLDWSPDGQLLVTAGRNGDITIWDSRTLTALRTIECPEWVIRVRFSPNGERLITAGGSFSNRKERAVSIWGLP